MARPGTVRHGALLLGLALPGLAAAACLELASHPDGAALARLPVASASPEIVISHMHSVTRTPVEERYSIDGHTLVQTQMTFLVHGPGLPTAADVGGAMAIEDGRHVVAMTRRFDTVVMRVHADQSPRLHVAGLTRNLAEWGNRALSLRVAEGACPLP